MSINQIQIQLNKDVPLNRLDNTLEIGNKAKNIDSGVEKVAIRFNDRFKIEIHKNEQGDRKSVV